MWLGSDLIGVVLPSETPSVKPNSFVFPFQLSTTYMEEVIFLVKGYFFVVYFCGLGICCTSALLLC